MLKRLSLTNLGPAPRLDFDFAERLNIITGDIIKSGLHNAEAGL
jgi:hypothetical protein